MLTNCFASQILSINTRSSTATVDWTASNSGRIPIVTCDHGDGVASQFNFGRSIIQSTVHDGSRNEAVRRFTINVTGKARSYTRVIIDIYIEDIVCTC